MKNDQKLGVIIGGSGLVGGCLVNYFKANRIGDIEIYAPNSKRMNLRESNDIKLYFLNHKPDFIINTAITAIDSDPLLSFEINYLGSIHLARIAMEANIPYIHFSSAATLLTGENIMENDVVALTPDLNNYTKSKLMADLTLDHMHKTFGLDYTTIKLGVVYGKHDHKTQGFHRMLYSIADQAMPVMVTSEGIRHSYSNSKKIPPFVEYILENREEFSGQIYNFVDPEPVELASLIRRIKSYLNVKKPREIFMPYGMAKYGRKFIKLLVRQLSKIGVEARLPAELMFLENFFQIQTLSAKKLYNSSYKDLSPEVTIYSSLPEIIQYYITRWERLNLITSFNEAFFEPDNCTGDFVKYPSELLDLFHSQGTLPEKGMDVCLRKPVNKAAKPDQ